MHLLLPRTQIPDQRLDQPRPRARSLGELPNPHPTPAELVEETRGSGDSTPTQDSAVASEDEGAGADEQEEGRHTVSPIATPRRPRRRLSTYESSDGGMDLEDDVIGGSARR